MIRRRQTRELDYRINVTSLVDVSLTLLVVFMLVAPMMKHGIDVQLPKVSAEGVDLKNQLVVAIDADEHIYLNERRISPAGLVEHLRGSSAKEVFLKADRDVTHGFVMKVLGKIREGGISNVGMVSEPG